MAKNAAKVDKGRTYISQADVPSYSLEKALRIPRAIGDNYGYKPTTPLQVAKALEMAPGVSSFKMLTGAAIAYGLTTGGYNASIVSITPLGLRIVRPTAEGDDLLAKREALLKPRVIREFLTKYDAAPFPKDSIAQNVLMEMGVPQDRTLEVLSLIVEGAESVGFIHTIKDRKYVELGGTPIPESSNGGGDEPSDSEGEDQPRALALVPPVPAPKPLPSTTTAMGTAPLPTDNRVKRVFITHGKNKLFIDPIRKLLAFGELEAVGLAAAIHR